MGEMVEKARNVTICGRRSTNFQNFMLFTITYGNLVKNFSFASKKDALTRTKQDDTIRLLTSSSHR